MGTGVSPEDQVERAGTSAARHPFPPAPPRKRLLVEAWECEQSDDLAALGLVRIKIMMDFGGWQYVSVPKGCVHDAP